MTSEYWDGFWRNRASRRRVLGAGAAFGAGTAGLALVGCGNDDDDGPSPTATPRPGETPAPGETPDPGDDRHGGTMRYPMVGVSSGDPPTLYPFENLTYLAQHPAHLHYSRLLRPLAGPDIAATDYTQLTGDIVDTWEQADDTTFIFKMKPNVHWQDLDPMNGRKATMTDFAETYQVFLGESPNAGKFEAVIDSLVAVDDDTLEVKLTEPFAPFLVTHAASSEGVWFIPAETVLSGQVQTQPVGSGPFHFVQWRTGVAIDWERNPNYYDAPVPYYDALEVSMQRDPARIMAALEAGDLDWSSLTATVHDEGVARLDPAGTHYYTPTGVLGAFFFNFDNDGGRWHDKRLRQALSMACDRQGWLNTLDQTGEGDWQSHLSPALAPYFMSPRDQKDLFGETASLFEHNPAESRALLQAATGQDSINVRVTANVDRYGEGARASWELFSAQISEHGFNVELVYQEYGLYIGSTYLGDIPEGIGLGPLIGAPVDPNDIFATNLESTSARTNWGGTPIDEMDEIDSMFARQRTIFDLEERIEYIQEIQRVLADSMMIVPYTGTPLWGYIQPWVQNLHVKGGYTYQRDSVAESWFTPERIAQG